MPDNLGVHKKQLAACPDTPNCVCSFDTDEEHGIAPLTYEGSQAEAFRKLNRIISGMPRTRIVEERNDYIHAEFTSLIFRFVDDVEFYFPKGDHVIHMRSASRIGHSDFSVNRKRADAIRQKFQQED